MSDNTSLPTIREADKPWYLTLALLMLFSFFTLFYLTFLYQIGRLDESREFAYTAFNMIAGWCGIGIGFYLRGRVHGG
ncbi:MAG: hypothetical protein QW282_06275 [Nitrososphaerales archaeon]